MTSSHAQHKLDGDGNNICEIKVDCSNSNGREDAREEALEKLHSLTKQFKCENWQLIETEENYSLYFDNHNLNIVCKYRKCYYDIGGGSLLS